MGMSSSPEPAHWNHVTSKNRLIDWTKRPLFFFLSFLFSFFSFFSTNGGTRGGHDFRRGNELMTGSVLVGEGGRAEGSLS